MIAISLVATLVRADTTLPDDSRFFDQMTGYRISNYRSPTPEMIEGVHQIDATTLNQFLTRNSGPPVVLLDAYGAQHFTITDTGDWIIAETHESLPGALWLPSIGWGDVEPWALKYLEETLAGATAGNKAVPVVTYCRTDCWLGWNATRRLQELGYKNLLWFPGGTDEWADAGFPLEPITPQPLGPDALEVFGK